MQIRSLDDLGEKDCVYGLALWVLWSRDTPIEEKRR